MPYFLHFVLSSGLHGYSATIELRNHVTTLWGRQYRELYQRKFFKTRYMLWKSTVQPWNTTNLMANKKRFKVNLYESSVVALYMIFQGPERVSGFTSSWSFRAITEKKSLYFFKLWQRPIIIYLFSSEYRICDRHLCLLWRAWQRTRLIREADFTSLENRALQKRPTSELWRYHKSVFR